MKHKWFFFQFAYTDLRAGEVGKDSNCPVKLFCNLADSSDYLFMAFEISVGKVDPCYIHACKHKCRYHFLGRRSWAYCADDLCLMVRDFPSYTAFNIKLLINAVLKCSYLFMQLYLYIVQHALFNISITTVSYTHLR